eukprot:11487855-Alexandrium_andersonii.AAC.1
MSASLVGSEMCIRDSQQRCRQRQWGVRAHCRRGRKPPPQRPHHFRVHQPVSYTHLTLPTICSV